MTKGDPLKRVREILLRSLSDSGVEGNVARHTVIRWLKMKDKTPEWLLAELGRPPPPVFLPMDFQLNNPVEQVNYLSTQHGYLSDRELEFVMRLQGKLDARGHLVLSRKQANWLRSIYARVKIVAPINEVKT